MKILFLLSRVKGLREVVAPGLLSIASRKRVNVDLAYCEAGKAGDNANRNPLSITENKYPLANTSFLQPLVLYYTSAVRMALSPNAGLKQRAFWRVGILRWSQNGAKPECEGRR